MSIAFLIVNFSNYSILEHGLECYYCGHEEGDECGSEMPDDSPYFVCQMSSPDEPHYGDSCYVGHSGTAVTFDKYMTMQEYSILLLVYSMKQVL